MKVFSSIREFFWPLLEKEIINDPILISINDIKVNDKHLEKTLEYAISNYDSEMERKKTIESKSSLFIGTISVVTSVIIGVTSILVKTNEFGQAITILVFLLFLLSLYMARTVWFSIKAIERGSYNTISIKDFLIDESIDNEYYKKIITEITNKIRKNYQVINDKVDNMTMAQEYFKRSIVIVVIYSFVIFLLLISKSELNFFFYISNLIYWLNQIHLSGWNTICMYILTILSLVLSIRATIKLK